MTPTELQEHINKTYYMLRGGLCALAVVFPPLLLLIGWWNGISFQSSMSNYYFAFDPHDSTLRVFPGRVVFVGILFALGVFLVLYRGFSRTEDRVLDIAGASLVVAALFPMQTPSYCDNCASNTWSPFVHGIAGAVLFLSTAFVAWACTEETLVKLSDPDRRWFRIRYDVLAAAMFFAPITVAAMTYIFGASDRKIYFAEWVGIWTFAAYWALKSYELSMGKGEVEKRAITGQTLEHSTEEPSLRQRARRWLG